MRTEKLNRAHSYCLSLMLLFLLVYGVVACKTKAQVEVNDQNKEMVEKSGNFSHSPVASVSGSQYDKGAKTNVASLESTATRLPGGARDSLKGQVRIIIPAWYRRDDYPVLSPQDHWQELYYDRSDKHWKTAATALKVRMVFEECSGDSAMVIASEHQAALLFTGLSGAPKVVSTITSQELLFPGHDLDFVMSGVQYKLTASSKSYNDKGVFLTRAVLHQNDQEDLRDYLKQLDYRLQLVEEQENPMDIFHIDSLEFTNPTLIWMGDLNNDNLPDMLLDIPQFTESSKYYLFLSDSNDEAMPIKFAAEIFIQRDC